MSIGIPDKFRKPAYVALIVIGVIAALAAKLDPALAASANDAVDQITQTLTALFGLVTAYGGVAALIHFTPSSPTGSANTNAPNDSVGATSDTTGTDASTTS